MSDNSESVRDLYQRYVSGECSVEEVERLYRHFASAKNEFELRRLINASLSEMPDGTGNHKVIRQEVFRRIKERIASATQEEHAVPLHWFQRYRGRVAAASLLFALSFFTAWYLTKSTPFSIGENWQEVVSRDGEVKAIVLPDSSKVWLNSNSKLNYRSPFAKGSRDVVLEGEAFFEISEDSSRPFTVLSHDVRTRVLGTSFNINAPQQSRDVRVSVKTGKVKIVKEAYEGVFERGSEFRYDRKADRIDVGVVSSADIGSWKSIRSFHFRNQSIGEVLTALEEHFGVTVHYPKALGDCPVIHADFKSTDPLEKILKILVTPLDGQVVKMQEDAYFLSGEPCM